jgi:hypothetical protein
MGVWRLVAVRSVPTFVGARYVYVRVCVRACVRVCVCVSASQSGALQEGRQEHPHTAAAPTLPTAGPCPVPPPHTHNPRPSPPRGYLDGLCRAVRDDAVNLSAFFAWSLVDNLEWSEARRPPACLLDACLPACK